MMTLRHLANGIVEYVDHSTKSYGEVNEFTVKTKKVVHLRRKYDRLARLEEIKPKLIARFDAKKVAALMYSRSLLIASELESIQCSATSTKAARKLLDIILEQSEGYMFDGFLSALNETNQQHISSWVSSPDYEIDFGHEITLKKLHPYLVQTIDSSTQLIDELYSEDVLDYIDREELTATSTDSARNAKLLSMLRRKSSQDFQVFLSALSAIGQEFVAEKIRSRHQRRDPSSSERENETGSDSLVSPNPKLTTKTGSDSSVLGGSVAVSGSPRYLTDPESPGYLGSPVLQRQCLPGGADLAGNQTLIRFQSLESPVSRSSGIPLSPDPEYPGSPRTPSGPGSPVIQGQGLPGNPQLLATIDEPPSHSDGHPCSVIGVTMLDNYLYVVYEEYSKVAMFDCEDRFKTVKDFQVREQKKHPWKANRKLKDPSDMVSCDDTRQLFISECKSGVIWRVDIWTGVSDVFITRDFEPGDMIKACLSLVDNQLLVRSPTSLSMYEIHSGRKIRDIPYTEDMKRNYIWHAIKSHRDSFFVSHGQWTKNHTVSEIDSDGRVIRVFNNEDQLHCYYLALDSAGHLFVSDLNSDSVVLLDEKLNYKGTLFDGKKLNNSKPLTLYYNKKKNRLTVGLSNGQLKIFDCNAC